VRRAAERDPPSAPGRRAVPTGRPGLAGSARLARPPASPAGRLAPPAASPRRPLRPAGAPPPGIAAGLKRAQIPGLTRRRQPRRYCRRERA